MTSPKCLLLIGAFMRFSTHPSEFSLAEPFWKQSVHFFFFSANGCLANCLFLLLGIFLFDELDVGAWKKESIFRPLTPSITLWIKKDVAGKLCIYLFLIVMYHVFKPQVRTNSSCSSFTIFNKLWVSLRGSFSILYLKWLTLTL